MSDDGETSRKENFSLRRVSHGFIDGAVTAVVTGLLGGLFQKIGDEKTIQRLISFQNSLTHSAGDFGFHGLIKKLAWFAQQQRIRIQVLKHGGTPNPNITWNSALSDLYNSLTIDMPSTIFFWTTVTLAFAIFVAIVKYGEKDNWIMALIFMPVFWLVSVMVTLFLLQAINMLFGWFLSFASLLVFPVLGISVYSIFQKNVETSISERLLARIVQRQNPNKAGQGSV